MNVPERNSCNSCMEKKNHQIPPKTPTMTSLSILSCSSFTEFPGHPFNERNYSKVHQCKERKIVSFTFHVTAYGNFVASILCWSF